MIILYVWCSVVEHEMNVLAFSFSVCSGSNTGELQFTDFLQMMEGKFAEQVFGPIGKFFH